ncbi:MAG: hypothetical protein AAF638_07735 [Pseudomonadota bacterium]
MLANAGNLPTFDTFGDELGCKRLNSDPNRVDEPGGITISSSELVGYEWYCRFAEVWPMPQNSYAVQGVCSGEGIPFLEQYIIQLPTDANPNMTIYSARGEQRWTLKSCGK